MHGVPDAVREGGFSDLHGHPAVLRHHDAVDDGPGDPDILQVAEEDDIGALARGAAAHLMVHAKTGCRVDGHVLDGFDRIQALPDGAADDMIQVAVVDQRIGMGVV